MELADPRTIEELLAAHERITRGRSTRKKDSQPVKVPAAQARTKRCHCGTCTRCREEARWERIFNERFADPNYYKHRPASFGSSMGWLTRPSI